MLETLIEPKPLPMEQCFGLGNQQESSRSLSDQNELSYLAGLFDGEGYIGIAVRHMHGKVMQYYPRVTITNTNPVIIKTVRDILTKHGVSFYVSEWMGKIEHKTRWTIEMVGFKKSLRFLVMIEPYLVAKRFQSQIAMAFVWSRLAHGKSYKHVPYTQDEIGLFLAMKELNAKGREILREHTSRAADFAAKMCSELHSKGAEVTETMAHLERGRGWNLSRSKVTDSHQWRPRR